MEADELSLGDLGIVEPERPLPKGARFASGGDLPARTEKNTGARGIGTSAVERCDRTPQTLDEVAAPFERVPVADLLDTVPPAPLYWWQGLVPAGHVTLLGAHGGTGKSMLGLMLACAMAAGLPLFGLATRRAVVAYFSAEDPASVVRHRLHLICRAMGLDPAELEPRLHVLDATGGDPALFREVSAAGMRQGILTPTAQALAEYMEAQDVDVLIVDNASDTYDASEIDRARVRAFMRNLSNLAQPDRAVLLLAHVDKGTSRGDRSGTEGYSGSTAWHNSARSRLYLSRDKDGALLLEHQKHNLGPLCAPMRLLWPAGGIPTLAAPVEGFVQHIADGTDTKSLLKLLHEFHSRGEFVAASQYSPANASRILASERGYPKRRPAEVFGLLRDAERRGLIDRETYRTADRKERDRWTLTAQGMGFIGASAPTAPTAQTYGVGAMPKAGARGAPTAQTCGAGGVGGLARAQMGDQGAAG